MNEKEPFVARVVSIILHPLCMAIYGVCLLFLYTDFYFIFGNQFIRFVSPVILFSFLIPFTAILIMKRVGLITSYDLKDKEERFMPFMATFFSYLLLFFYFYHAGLYMWFLGLLAAPLVLLIVASMINIHWKISAHMMGIGGLIGGVLSVCYNVKGLNSSLLFILLFILAGCLGVARLTLRRHTPAQVYVGFVIGLLISYISVWVGANVIIILN